MATIVRDAFVIASLHACSLGEQARILAGGPARAKNAMRGSVLTGGSNKVVLGIHSGAVAVHLRVTLKQVHQAEGLDSHGFVGINAPDARRSAEGNDR